jgi:hypothetical protein
MRGCVAEMRSTACRNLDAEQQAFAAAMMIMMAFLHCLLAFFQSLNCNISHQENSRGRLRPAGVVLLVENQH